MSDPIIQRFLISPSRCNARDLHGITSGMHASRRPDASNADCHGRRGYVTAGTPGQEWISAGCSCSPVDPLSSAAVIAKYSLVRAQRAGPTHAAYVRCGDFSPVICLGHMPLFAG